MPQPSDILDAPGPLPDEVDASDVIEAPDDTDPHVTQAMGEHPGLNLRDARWDDVLDAVVVPRAELEKVEGPLRWEVWHINGHLYVLAYFDNGVTLAAKEPAPMFEGAYIASRDLRHARCA